MSLGCRRSSSRSIQAYATLRSCAHAIILAPCAAAAGRFERVERFLQALFDRLGRTDGGDERLPGPLFEFSPVDVADLNKRPDVFPIVVEEIPDEGERPNCRSPTPHLCVWEHRKGSLICSAAS